MLKCLLLTSFVFAALGACPDRAPGLRDWSPGRSTTRDVVVGRGQLLRLAQSGEVRSLIIRDGGKVVWASDKEVTLKARRVLIRDGGELHIGAADCPYTGAAAIVLKGRSNEDTPDPDFGRKFIGVGPGGVLELHGQKKLSWTQLTKTLYPGAQLYDTKNYYQRGFNVLQLDGKTGAFVDKQSFDTYAVDGAAAEFVSYLRNIPRGRIVVLTTHDEASTKLSDAARAEIKNLGSKTIDTLGHRDTFVLITKKGSKTLTKEVHSKYTADHKATATLSMNFKSTTGAFQVTGLSTWDKSYKHGWFLSKASVTALQSEVILTLKDSVASWNPSDTIVVASTDYNMDQAEEFKLVPCPECQPNQIKISAVVKYTHFGQIDRGVDMRAEVGLLTRNIKITAEVEKACYGDNQCRFFDYDTFGGHLKILKGFKSVHIEGIEMSKMGQQKLGFYPVHFHLAGDVDQKGGYSSPTYVKDVSIHHCFSRCVTIHGTHGLLVQDTVGYDTLGHCYFLEDGVERRNTLRHNLGLVTRFGTVLPSDRSPEMCKQITANVYKGYQPTNRDCFGLATFWITHPDNNLIDNAAAGSQVRGFWYVFHRSPTGASVGALPALHAEHSPMGANSGNRAHSNANDGLHIDGGVKTTPASAQQPSEFLAVNAGARYKPHQDSDTKKPRVPAKIVSYTAFKNGNMGSWVRGGDIFFINPRFADNAYGVTLASEGIFPNDPGSRQEVSGGIFIGESRNRGNFDPAQSWRWQLGADSKHRSFPTSLNFPRRGVSIYDGPVVVKNSRFYEYHMTPRYNASAIGFHLRNNWQMATTSFIEGARFDAKSVRAYGGSPGGWFGPENLDGDKLKTLLDKDGSLTGTAGAHVMRPDNALMVHSGCRVRKDWNLAVCKGDYATLFIIGYVSNAKVRIYPDHNPSKYQELQGVHHGKTYGSNYYLPNVLLRESYTLQWIGATPNDMTIYPINFNKGDWMRLGICLAAGAKITEVKFYQTYRPVILPQVGSARQLDSQQGGGYFFDSSSGMLFIRIEAKQDRTDYNYCPAAACDYIKVKTDKRTSGSSDCAARAYPKYRVNEPARQALAANWATVG